MTVGSYDLSRFKGHEAELEQSFDQASSDDQSQNKPLTISGTYVMEVSTICFKNKKQNNKLIISPVLADSAKGGVNLVASMKVIDGTKQVPAGSYTTINIPVWPAPNASKEEAEKLFRLSKPRLCALLGVDNFKLTTDTLLEKFTADWKENEDGSFKLVKDHALKGKVVCIFEDSVYQNKATLNLVSLRKFKEGDESISNEVQETSGFGSSEQVADSAPSTDEAPDFDNSEQIEENAPATEAPAIEQSDDLPF